jgi:copper chaperone for superoxide dismutase
MLVDLTLRGVKPGTYHITVRETGDISRGAMSTDTVWGRNNDVDYDDRRRRGDWGEVEVQGESRKGSVFLDQEVGLSEVIGRAMVVSQAATGPEADGAGFGEQDETTVVGVIARSAGVWENEKTVCSCSGKNVWEERKEQVGKGMM